MPPNLPNTAPRSSSVSPSAASSERTPDERIQTGLDGTNESLGRLKRLTANGISVFNNTNCEKLEFEVSMPDCWNYVTAYQNGWTDFGGGERAAWMKHPDGTVEIAGNISSGAVGTTAFVLPEPCRPASTRSYATNSNAAFGALFVLTDGSVKPAVGSPISFSVNCRFLAKDPRPPRYSCFPVNCATRLPKAPVGVIVIKAKSEGEQSQSIGPQVFAVPEWRYINSNGSPTIQILNIAGLPYSRKTRLTLIAFGE